MKNDQREKSKLRQIQKNRRTLFLFCSQQRPKLSACLRYIPQDAGPEVLLSSARFVAWSLFPVVRLVSPLHQTITEMEGSSWRCSELQPGWGITVPDGTERSAQPLAEPQHPPLHTALTSPDEHNILLSTSFRAQPIGFSLRKYALPVQRDTAINTYTRTHTCMRAGRHQRCKALWVPSVIFLPCGSRKPGNVKSSQNVRGETDRNAFSADKVEQLLG